MAESELCMSKYQRTKGAGWERDRANWWKKLGFKEARRNLNQYQKPDGRDLLGVPGFCEQDKCGKNINIYQAYVEAVSAANPIEIPIAAIKYDNKTPLIVMSEADFEKLLKKGGPIYG